jgi:hypothetical protein
MAEERLKALKGRVHIMAWKKNPDFPDDRSKDIQIKDTTFDNLIVNVGKDSILKRLGGTGLSCFGEAGGIGVGDSTQAAALTDTDLIAASNKVWNDISTAIGLCDDQGTPGNSPAEGSSLWARQVDGTPLVKDSSTRAIVEWQLTL